MTEPSEESMMRAVTALTPFVRAFRLPVNPEELDVMAYAVLRFADSAEELPAIAQAVDELIADQLAAHARLGEAMQRSVRDPDTPGETADA
jgi:hypothetical protein